MWVVGQATETWVSYKDAYACRTTCAQGGCNLWNVKDWQDGPQREPFRYVGTGQDADKVSECKWDGPLKYGWLEEDTWQGWLPGSQENSKSMWGCLPFGQHCLQKKIKVDGSQVNKYVTSPKM